MTYNHITTDELVFIEDYLHHGTTVAQIAKQLRHARQTIHNVITHFKAGHTAIDYYQHYKENKKRCARKRTLLPEGRTSKDIETAINTWCHRAPRNLCKSITFDCGKESSTAIR